MGEPNKHDASEKAFHPVGAHRIGMSQEDEAKAIHLIYCCQGPQLAQLPHVCFGDLPDEAKVAVITILAQSI